MSHPSEPSFGRHGEYSTGRTAVEAFRQGTFKQPTNMYHGNGQSEALTPWMKVQQRMDSVRDMLADRCCRCFHRIPSLGVLIAIIIWMGLLIAAVPLAFVLISNSQSESKAEALTANGRLIHPIRQGHMWPGYNDIADASQMQEESELRAISSASLFPPNVSLCHGFGFACTSMPSMVISTTQRCDGHEDCPDGSDELSCRECQTPFWCDVASGHSSSSPRVCLRADQLCDGINRCDDRADEIKLCRKESEECPPSTRRCKNSVLCLPQESFCDGEIDCREEDDELKCTNCTRGAKFCKPSGRCIARRQLCDGVVNCEDGSDEKDCDCKMCSGSDRALCGNNQCIRRSRVCDGASDCGDLDEENCPGTCKSSDGKSEMPFKDVETVQCQDGRRYPISEACTGLIRVCAHSCKKCDARLAFTCGDGQCIRKMQVCDGKPDCSKGEDEAKCDDLCTSSPPTFKCKTGSKCIPSDAKCDGVRDCLDGSDEVMCTKCPSDALFCPMDGRCFPGVARCDGVPDCSDGSDESDCTCAECTTLHSETYSCEASSHCFRRETVCNPYSRCPNATRADRLFCASRAAFNKHIF